MIITASSLQALMVGFRKEFQGGLASTETQWTKVATRVPSSTKSNTYGWLGQFPRFREWVGDRVINDMEAHGYSITNKNFESTIGVSRDDIEEDNLGVYSPLFQEMGLAAAEHPEELVFGLLKDGHNQVCYDGQNFFDSEHPVYPNADGTGAAALVSNQDIPALAEDQQTPWYLLDVTRALKPLIFQERRPYKLQAMTKDDDEKVFMANEYRYGVDARCNVGFGFWQMAYKSQQPLTVDNYAKARAAMRSFKANGGKPLNVKPTLLVVPPNLEKQALEVLKAERDAQGKSNVYHNTADLMVTAWVE
jgi:phage major head subunit gpT-like protein